MIFLRNVLIYFDALGKVDIVRRVLARLKPGGCLLTGMPSRSATWTCRCAAWGPRCMSVPELTRQAAPTALGVRRARRGEALNLLAGQLYLGRQAAQVRTLLGVDVGGHVPRHVCLGLAGGEVQMRRGQPVK